MKLYYIAYLLSAYSLLYFESSTNHQIEKTVSNSTGQRTWS